MKFKILAADKLAPEGLKFIESQADVTLVNRPGLSEDELTAIIGEHDGLIVRSAAKVTAHVLANPGQLKAIARAGIGVDNIDLETATAKGILVMNSAEASTISTAEHTFALMLALARDISAAHRTMTAGGWDRSRFTGSQLYEKTLGVVGFGRIGQAVAERALAFGMKVVAHDPFINAETMMDGQVKMHPRFEDLLPDADVLTFHVPLNDQTHGMLNSKTLALCREGVRVVNAARGGVVAEDDIIAALDSGRCGGAAFDVYEQEPPAPDHPLRSHPRAVLSPHLAASTKEAQEAVSISAAKSLLTYLRGEGITGAVNAGDVRVDLDPLQQCFADLAKRMAMLISPMITEGIARVTVELVGAELAHAAGTINRTALVNLLASHLDQTPNIINVQHLAEQRGIDLRAITVDADQRHGRQLSLVIEGPAYAEKQPQVRRIVGRVYDDLRPRVVDINGYHMDMIPAGVMVLIQNDDRPGMIGVVGNEFGNAQVNIADMALSRREQTALMLIKVDEEPSAETLASLRGRDGILKVAMVALPAHSP